MTLLSLLPMLGVSQDMALPTLAKMAAQNGGQSFGAGAFQTLTGWTTLFDTASAFVPSTGLYTAPADGYYLVSLDIFTNTVPQNTSVFLSVFVNAAEQIRSGVVAPSAGGSLGNGACSFNGLVHASKNDVLKVVLTNFTGAGISLLGIAVANYWSIAQQL